MIFQNQSSCFICGVHHSELPCTGQLRVLYTANEIRKGSASNRLGVYIIIGYLYSLLLFILFFSGNMDYSPIIVSL